MTGYSSTSPPLVQFETDDLVVGDLLGVGGFSAVYAVELSYTKFLEVEDRMTVQRTQEEESSFIMNSSSSSYQRKPEGTFLSQHHHHQSTQVLDYSEDSSSSSSSDEEDESLTSWYGEEDAHVIKLLKPTLRERLVDSAATDLENEVQILSELSYHPNIVTLCGVSSNFWESPSQGFLVLERLIQPLDHSLVQWRNEAAPYGGFIKKSWRSTRVHVSHTLLAQRLETVALPIARAMAFLHQHQILFRDLKPANCGYDTSGTIRLFDFGFARQLSDDDCGKLTGQVGTLRYMAPEVAACQNYGFPADVHSFAMFLWELCTLQRPFGHVKTIQDMLVQVRDKESHPSLQAISGTGLQTLLTASWHPDPAVRPTFDRVITRLEEEVNHINESRHQRKVHRPVANKKHPTQRTRRSNASSQKNVAKFFIE
mmetsp:Transcript_32011/g.66829  ORF Transcript_32011/g.66829 Transcript_32011/m.66829 type:complete len:426 (-) Transcript_32011:1240-2517(-)